VVLKSLILIDNRLFGCSFLPSILVTTYPRYPATISPSLVLNRIELVEITYLSAGHYKSKTPNLENYKGKERHPPPSSPYICFLLTRAYYHKTQPEVTCSTPTTVLKPHLQSLQLNVMFFAPCAVI